MKQLKKYINGFIELQYIFSWEYQYLVRQQFTPPLCYKLLVYSNFHSSMSPPLFTDGILFFLRRYAKDGFAVHAYRRIFLYQINSMNSNSNIYESEN